MGRSLLNCTEKLYTILNKIIKKNVELDANFFELLKEFFEKFEKKCLIRDFSAAEIQLSQYALVALIDELVSHYHPHGGHHWPARSLQLYYYQTNVAGNLFFENLETLLLDAELNASVLEVYYFCLQLDFKGQYQQADPKLLDYRQRLKTFFGSEKLVDLSMDTHQSHIILWQLLIALLFLSLFAYAGFIIFINQGFLVATTVLEHYAEQINDA